MFIIIGLLLWPLFLDNRYLFHTSINAGIYLMLTMGLFVLSGITGQLNMGQAAFWAIGAYSYAIAIGRLGWPFLGAALFAIVITISISLIFGLTALRVSGIYFAMVTLGLGEIVRIVLLNWRKLSGGGMGMRNIPCPAILGTVIKTPAQFYILTLVLVLLCFYVTRRLLTAYVGLSMKGVGSNEVVAKGLGINAFRVKLLALAVSSFFAAMAGVVFSSYYRFLHPDAFTSAQSFFLVQMLVIGGIHSLLGVVAITPLLTFSLEYLRALGEYQMIAYAGLLILFLIFCPQGVGGLVERCLRERNPKHNSLHNSRGSEENI